MNILNGLTDPFILMAFSRGCLVRGAELTDVLAIVALAQRNDVLCSIFRPIFPARKSLCFLNCSAS